MNNDINISINTPIKHTNEIFFKKDMLNSSKNNDIYQEYISIINPLFGPALSRLSGGHYLSMFVNLPQERKILLLGEIHTTSGACNNCSIDSLCYNIDDYIYALVGKKRECIDLFQETYFILKKGGDYKKQNKQDIIHSREYWENITADRPYPYLRYHYWDMRQLIPYKSLCQKPSDCQKRYHPITYFFKNRTTPIRDDQIMANVNALNEKYDEYDVDRSKLIRYFFLYFLTRDPDESITIFINLLYKSLGIEFDNEDHIYIQTVKEKIIKQYNKQTLLSKKNPYESFINECERIWKRVFTDLHYSISISITLCITDIYLFLRIFTEYDSKYRSRSHKGCEITYNKNCIVYAGAHHIRYLEALISNFTKISPLYQFENQDEYNQCIEFPTKQLF